MTTPDPLGTFAPPVCPDCGADLMVYVDELERPDPDQEPTLVDAMRYAVALTRKHLVDAHPETVDEYDAQTAAFRLALSEAEELTKGTP